MRHRNSDSLAAHFPFTARDSAGVLTMNKEADYHIPTLGEALSKYVEIRKIKPRTADTYKSRTERYLGDWLELPIDKITSVMVEERYQEISKRAPTTATQTLKQLSAFISFATKYWMTSDGKPLPIWDPVHRLSAIGAWHTTGTRLGDEIPEDKIRTFFQAVMSLNSETCRDVLLVLLLTGMRVSEVRHLRWSNIDLDNGYISIAVTKNGKPLRQPMSDYVREIFRLRKLRDIGGEFVFKGRDSVDMPVSNLFAPTKVVSQRVGFNIRCHDLRRTFCAIASHPDIGADIMAIKGLLNHSTGDVTTEHYLLIHPERLRPTVQGITDFVLRRAGIRGSMPDSVQPPRLEPPAPVKLEPVNRYDRNTPEPARHEATALFGGVTIAL